MTGQSAREQQIRRESARYGGDDCSCNHCYLLRLLDAERAKVDALTSQAAYAGTLAPALTMPVDPTLRSADA